ncbi:DUF6191 domain-containing protein [Kitasatospora hibisci]|uniref:DUF6191 domain-containing protein n=1 Tax=Kitasatospora hibisci TaxID=3369522 RepID=UPI0037541B9D
MGAPAESGGVRPHAQFAAGGQPEPDGRHSTRMPRDEEREGAPSRTRVDLAAGKAVVVRPGPRPSRELRPCGPGRADRTTEGAASILRPDGLVGGSGGLVTIGTPVCIIGRKGSLAPGRPFVLETIHGLVGPANPAGARLLSPLRKKDEVPR